MVKAALKMILIGVLVALTSACEKTDETPSTDTGAGMTLSSLAKTWTSGCIIATDPITGANRTKIELALTSNGTFTQHQYWYTGGSCINYAIDYSTSGTFTIGSKTSNAYPLAFTVTASTMMAWNTTVQASVNTACGGTSPYAATPDAADNGYAKSTYMMICTGMTLPSSSNKFVDNVGSLSGDVLSLGQNQNGVPGGFQGGGSVPTSTSVDYY